MTEKERGYYENLYPEGTFGYARLYIDIEDMKTSIKDELRAPFHRLLGKLTVIVQWLTKQLRNHNDNTNR